MDIRGNIQTLTLRMVPEVVSNVSTVIAGDSLTFAYDAHGPPAHGVESRLTRPHLDVPLRCRRQPGVRRQPRWHDQTIPLQRATANFPHALTGITDERGIRYASFDYQADGRAVASYHAGNAQRVDIAITTPTAPAPDRQPRPRQHLRNAVQLGVALVTGVDGPGCSTCGAGDTTYVYDPANNNLLSKTANGVTTQYGNYDAKGQYGCKVEGVTAADPSTGECAFDPVDSPDASRTDYTYDSRFFHKITGITEPSVNPAGQKVTSSTYDDYGNRLTETVSGYAPDGQGGYTAVSRSQRWQYGGDGSPECDAVPLHQLCRHDGPRTDLADVTVSALLPRRCQPGQQPRAPETDHRRQRRAGAVQHPVQRHRPGPERIPPQRRDADLYLLPRQRPLADADRSRRRRQPHHALDLPGHRRGRRRSPRPTARRMPPR